MPPLSLLFRPRSVSSASTASPSLPDRAARANKTKREAKVVHEDSSAPKRKQGKWRKRLKLKNLKKLFSRNVKVKAEPDGEQSTQQKKTHVWQNLFQPSEYSPLPQPEDAIAAPADAQPKDLPPILENLKYTEFSLPKLIRNKGYEEQIARQAGLPIDKIKDEINVVLAQEVLKYKKEGGESAEAILNQVISADKDIGDVMPDFPWKEEFDTLNETQSFAAQMEKEQAQIDGLAQKVDDGTASNKDRQTLSEKLYASQANLAIAQTHLGQMFARHAQRADRPGVELVVLAGIIAQGLSERLAVHHMAAANMISKYADGETLPPSQIARPADQLNHQLQQTKGLLFAVALRHNRQAIENNPQVNAAVEELKAQCGELEKKIAAHLNAAKGQDDGSIPLRDKLVKSNPPPPTLNLSEDLMPSKELLARGAKLALNTVPRPTIENHPSFYVDQQAHNYRSITEPGGAGIAQNFANAYTGIVPALSQQETFHVPNLARSALQTQDGEVLFQANRHAAINAAGVTPDFLRQLPRNELVNLLDRAYGDDIPLETKNSQLEKLADDIIQGTGNLKLEPMCREIQQTIHKTMGREIIAAALIADPAKFELARKNANLEDVYNEETDAETIITVPLNAISLMTPESSSASTKSERENLASQIEGLRAASNDGKPFKLPIGVPNEQGEMVIAFVPVKVELRQFNFAVEPAPTPASAPQQRRRISFARIPFLRRRPREVTAWGYSMQLNDPAMTSLLGDRQEQELGGGVAAKLNFLQIKLERLRERRETIIEFQDRGGTRNARRHSGQLLLDTEKGIKSVIYDANRILQCADQVKDIWRSQEFHSQGSEPHKFASRLALLCHAIGESPSISDLNGLDRVNRCDADAKYLAAAFDTTTQLPKPDQEEGHAQRAHFALNCGGEELRRYNTL